MIDHEIFFDGDLIKNLSIKKNMAVRPLWRVMEALSPDEMLIWVDRFDSLCPIASEWALAQALEDSAGLIIPKRVQFVRSIYAEINRLIYLTTYLGGVLREVGLNTNHQLVLVLREQVFQKQEELMGGRILPQVFKMGSVRRDLALGDIQKVRQFVQGWKFGWEKWKDLTLGDTLLESRLENLLKISKNEIKRKSFWGLVGKGNGILYDSRLHQPHGAYAHIPWKLEFSFPLNGDALSRFNVAVYEIDLALQITEELLKNIPVDSIEKTEKYELKEGIFTGCAESGRGPVKSVVEVDGAQRVRSVKLFNCSQRVWPQIENYFLGQRAEDFGLSWNSLGLSAEESEI
jgi:Ni,Fe-hydrogenase III large subunit